MELKETDASEENAIVPAYVPTQEEKRALATRKRRTRSRAPLPRIHIEDKKADDGKISRRLGWQDPKNPKAFHPDTGAASELFHACLNSVGNIAFVAGLLHSLTEATVDLRVASAQQDIEELINFCLPVLQGVKPQDEIEALLAVQMVATHTAFIRMTKKHVRATNPLNEQIYEKQVNRFARTFVAQMQALKVYRAKGKQSIVVKHVTVSHGGQAIIGSVKGRRGRRGVSAEPEATS